MAIISVLASLSISTFSGANSGQSLRRAIISTSGYLDSARARAASTNTYVYVAIDTSGPGVRLLMFESRTGLDALRNKSSVSVATDPDLVPSQPLLELSDVSFEDANATYTPTIPDLSATSADKISSDAAISYQQGGKTIQFDRLITFLPSGQIRNGETFSPLMEFGFQEKREGVVLPNPAAFQLSGLTGQIRVFRP